MIIFDKEHNIIIQDPARQIQDSSLKKIIINADTIGIADIVTSVNDDTKIPVIRRENTEIASVSLKNRVGDVIYSGNQDQINNFYHGHKYLFPFNYIGTDRQFSTSAIITSHLRDGKTIPKQPFNEDWIIAVVVLSAFVYSALSALPGKSLNNIKAFLLFRGIGDPASRERTVFFHWKSTLINFVTFSNIALFAYLSTDYHNFNPTGISGIILWLVFLVIIALSVTFRNIICFLVGNITDETVIFGEYLSTVYQAYQVTGFFLFLLSVLLTYTNLFHPETLFTTGIIFISAFYIMRIMRLFFIFLKHNISILYLILYLCALEFLPVLIVLRYLTNLF
ncbi:MAG TPA: hypothetical protein DDW27_06215 [Bacteroidales bacterium]|nr:hypothetical protein [Bacteroidales bacterium]